jgi:hypothetical protein
LRTQIANGRLSSEYVTPLLPPLAIVALPLLRTLQQLPLGSLLVPVAALFVDEPDSDDDGERELDLEFEREFPL